MLIRFLQRKWASDERDRAVLKEPVAHMGSTVGFAWYFRTATEIDPAQDQCPPVFVFEMGALDMNHYFTPPWEGDGHLATYNQGNNARSAGSDCSTASRPSATR